MPLGRGGEVNSVGVRGQKKIGRLQQLHSVSCSQS